MILRPLSPINLAQCKVLSQNLVDKRHFPRIVPELQMPSPELSKDPSSAILAALNFAAQKHSRQRRKDLEASPYINHPIAVAEVLSRIGGITDLLTLQSAILHDTIEDTETTPEEL